jgi:hypothetical protein
LCHPILVFITDAIMRGTDANVEKKLILQMCDAAAITEAKKVLWQASDQAVLGKMTLQDIPIFSELVLQRNAMQMPSGPSPPDLTEKMDEVTDAIAKLTGTLADLAQESADLKRRITEKEAPTEIAMCSPQHILPRRGRAPLPDPVTRPSLFT